MKRLVVVAALAACSDSGSSSALETLGGDVTFVMGTETVTPTYGAMTVDKMDATKHTLILSNRGIACGTTVEGFGIGTYFTVDFVAPAVGPIDTQGGLWRISGHHVSFNGTTVTGSIDVMDDMHVSGLLMFMTHDQDDMIDLGVHGTFDVENCP